MSRTITLIFTFFLRLKKKKNLFSCTLHKTTKYRFNNRLFFFFEVEKKKKIPSVYVLENECTTDLATVPSRIYLSIYIYILPQVYLPPNEGNPVKIACGTNHCLVITDKNNLYSWVHFRWRAWRWIPNSAAITPSGEGGDVFPGSILPQTTVLVTCDTQICGTVIAMFPLDVVDLFLRLTCFLLHGD